MFRTLACTAFAALLVVTPQAQTGTTIRIWKVGSPHTGDTPDTEMPPALAREAGTRNKPHHTSARKSLRDSPFQSR